MFSRLHQPPSMPAMPEHPRVFICRPLTELPRLPCSSAHIPVVPRTPIIKSFWVYPLTCSWPPILQYLPTLTAPQRFVGPPKLSPRWTQQWVISNMAPSYWGFGSLRTCAVPTPVSHGRSLIQNGVFPRAPGPTMTEVYTWRMLLLAMLNPILHCAPTYVMPTKYTTPSPLQVHGDGTLETPPSIARSENGLSGTNFFYTASSEI